VALACSLNHEEALIIKQAHASTATRYYYPPHPMLQMAYNSDTAPDNLNHVVVEVLEDRGNYSDKLLYHNTGFPKQTLG